MEDLDALVDLEKDEENTVWSKDSLFYGLMFSLNPLYVSLVRPLVMEFAHNDLTFTETLHA